MGMGEERFLPGRGIRVRRSGQVWNGMHGGKAVVTHVVLVSMAEDSMAVDRGRVEDRG